MAEGGKWYSWPAETTERKLSESNVNILLLEAAENGQTEKIKELLSQGADVKAKDTYHRTAVVLSAQNGHSESLSELIAAGADVNGLGNPALTSATWNGHHKCVEILIQAGADVNECNLSGRSPIILAAAKGYSKCLDVLTNSGADVNAKDNKGRTALIQAADFFITKEPFQLLLKFGAHINRQTNNGENALTYYFSRNYKCPGEVALLLYVAGETLDGSTISKLAGDNVAIPEYMGRSYRLMDMCRHAIRKYLIDLNPHAHLFGRVPSLGLPDSLTQYLLYSASLDEKGKD